MGAAAGAGPTRAQAGSGGAGSGEGDLALYRTMRLIRATHERLVKGLSSGEVACNYWPIEGQEAISAGAAAGLRPSDQVIVTYRGLGLSLAKGAEPWRVLAEYLGRTEGLGSGRGGAATGMVDPSVGLALSTGIVGAGGPIAGGLALSAVLQGRSEVVLVSFGDGATSTGALHEALVLASLWSLPVVFLCENNLYAEYTPLREHAPVEHLAARAASYGMAGETVDGTDPLVVRDAVARAAERARSGEGPTFLEAVAPRISGHNFGDPMAYVDPDDAAAARDGDPVVAFRARLIEDGRASDDQLAELDAQVAREVGEAMERAKAAPPPSADEGGLNVYSRPGAGFRSGVPADAQGLRDETLPASERKLGMAQAIAEALDLALAGDDSVVLLGEDIADPAGGTFRATKGLSTTYGRERVRPTPIAESAIVGAAIGAALGGMRPVAELMFMDFVAVCLDQILNHAAKLRYVSGGRLSVPLTIRTVVGKGVGPQHSQSLEALVAHIPGLQVIWPSTPGDAKGLLLAAIENDEPCIFIEAMSSYYGAGKGPVPEGRYTLPIGVAARRRVGSDVTVVAYGPAVGAALAAAEEAAAHGFELEVLDLRTLVPLDVEGILASVARTGRLVVAHDAVVHGGFGAEVAALVASEGWSSLRAPIARVGAPFTPVPYAKGLVEAHAATTDRILTAALALAGAGDGSRTPRQEGLVR